jgi:hypothetical protein
MIKIEQLRLSADKGLPQIAFGKFCYPQIVVRNGGF